MNESSPVAVDTPARGVLVTALSRAATIVFGVLIGAIVGLVTAISTGLLPFVC